MELLKISIQYKQDKEKELLRMCKSVTDQALQETDCLKSQVEEGSEENNTICLIQQWKDWSGLSSYFSSDQFKALLGAIKLFGRSYEVHINGTPRDITEIPSKNNSYTT